jgi:WD40 repeat protein
VIGRNIGRSSSPRDHARLLEHLRQVRAKNGSKSLRTIGTAMPLAYSRVSALLSGKAAPVDERQTGQLARAMGGGDDEVAEAVRLFRLAFPRAPAPRPGADRVDQMITAAWSTHWVPSATGGGPSGPGPGFHGRSAVMEHLAAWLAAAEGRKPRIVTGDPGSGKSAVLARFLMEVREHGARPAVVAAVHAHGRTLAEVVAIVARQYGVVADSSEELVTLLGRGPGRSLLVVDAVDESDEAEVLLTRLLRPLARQAQGSELRLLIGARRHLTRRIGERWVELVDLDAAYADLDALADYAAAILSSPEASPYRPIPDRTARVARAVAHRANGSFLIARLVGMALALRAAPATDLGEFPDSVLAAMEAYLDALPGDRRAVEELLRPLAFAEGAGLPSGLWLRLAGALCGLPGKYRPEDLEELFGGAVISLLTVGNEADVNGVRPVYRLFHDALAEALAEMRPASPEAPADPAAARLTIARSLRESVPGGGGRTDWSGADPYVRRHLATYAACTPLLSMLVEDPAFLLDADADRLLSALTDGVDGVDAVRARSAYELVADRLPGVDRPERAAYLALSGLQEGTALIAAGLHHLAGSAPWWPVRAAWETRARHRILYRHDDVVNAVTVISLDGEPLVVSGGDDRRVRIMSLTGRSGDEGQADIGSLVMCLAAVVLDGLPAVVAGGEDGHVYVLDVPTLHVLARSSRAHPRAVNVLVAVVEDDGTTTIVSGDIGGELCRWSVVPCDPVGTTVAAASGEISGLCRVGRLLIYGSPDSVRFLDDQLNPGTVLFEGSPAASAIVLFDVGPRRLVVSGHSDGSIRTFDPASGDPVSTIADVQDSDISALAVSGSRVLCGGESGVLTILDPTAPEAGRLELTGHDLPVLALAAASVGDRDVAVSAGEDKTVRQWDLDADVDDLPRQPQDRGTTALTTIHGREIAIQTSERTVRLRDLTDWAEIGCVAAVDPSATLMTTFAVAGDRTGLLVATGDSDGRVGVRKIERDETVARFIGHKGWVAGIEFADLDGEAVLVTVGHDDVLRVSAVGTGLTAVSPIDLPHVRGNVEALAVSSDDGRLLAAVATTGVQLQIWDVRSRRQVARAEVFGAGKPSTLTADGPLVFGGTVLGWTFTLSIDDQDPVCHHTHAAGVSTVTMGRLHGRRVLVSGSEHGDVVIREPDGTAVTSFALDARVQGLLLTDGGRLTVATSQGVVVVQLPS